MPRAAVREEALRSEADLAFADDQEEVGRRQEAPVGHRFLLLALDREAAGRLAREERHVALGVVALRPLRQILPEGGGHLPDLRVRRRHRALQAARERVLDDPAPDPPPGRERGAGVPLAALGLVFRVRRRHPGLDPVPQVAPETDLRKLHQDRLPVAPHAVVLPLPLRGGRAVQGAEELGAEALRRAVVGRAERSRGVEFQEVG
mmetsp:Transcript_85710/g.185002  ORF Transcript_85710/g.185002 Transcript_85710/m.185002 type:complete len:205 (+) Transcript_85710:432-1046(+)